MMWIAFHSILRRFVGAVFITCSEPKDDNSFIGKMGSNVKECGPSAEGRWKVYLIILHQRTWAIPGSDLGLIELMQRALYDKFAASSSVWISCRGRWILYGQLVPHRAYFTLLFRILAVKNPLKYMEVLILDFLSARMRQQPEDMDHLRCGPTKKLRWEEI